MSNEHIHVPHDKERSVNRRDLLLALAGFALGTGLPSNVEARSTKKGKPTVAEKPTPKKSIEKPVSSYEPSPEQLAEQHAYETVLSDIVLPERSVHSTPQGREVLVDDLVTDASLGIEEGAFPLPNPYKLFGKQGTGAVVIPEFHRVLLFKDGLLVRVAEKHIPVGTGRTDEDQTYHTPRGFFKVYRTEGKDYSSRKYPPSEGSGPNMGYASFFDPTGVATHGSTNFKIYNGREVLKLDSSHGCVNMRPADAKLLQDVLGLGGIILVLNDTRVKKVHPEPERQVPKPRLYQTLPGSPTGL